MEENSNITEFNESVEITQLSNTSARFVFFFFKAFLNYFN